MSEQQKTEGWQQKTTEVVYDNPWIQVSHDTVITPSGTDGIYGRVHFKNHAVGILPVDSEGGTWLVQQSRYPLNCKTWEIPEGGSPVGEDLLITAQRELLEETGYDSKNIELVASHFPNPALQSNQMHTFLARDCVKVQEQQLDEFEDLELYFCSLERLAQHLREGDIDHTIMIASVALALQKLK